MAIQILSPDIAAKIAAGEVIERPASVVKELVENAIDAEAESISIEIAKAGRRLIRVSDDGDGIPGDQVEIAFARHATSKLRTADDLSHIQTLGFRGEALASIAAVSHLTLATRVLDERIGTEIRLEGGEVRSQRRLGRPAGTMVQVENLFYNTPARLRFLRSDATESGHIARLVSSYALAYPEKRLTLKKDDRTTLQTYGTGDLSEAILAVYGLDVAEQMLPLEQSGDERQEIQVNGYVSAPQLNRSTRRDIVLFVNRRWIQDRSLSYAVEQAYHSLLARDRHPIAIVSISLPPEQVDVNIHPTKQEVRFRHQRRAFSAVQRAVRATLMAHHTIPVVSVPGEPAANLGTSAQQGALHLPQGREGRAPTTDHEQELTFETSQSDVRLPMLRVLGQIAKTYIIAEGPGGMYLIDQHAAHERIRYEQLKAQKAAQQPQAQELLEALPLDVAPAEADLLRENLYVLREYGLHVETASEDEGFLVTAVPTGMRREQVAAALSELLEAALGEKDDFSWEDQALVTLSCHTAIRAGKALSPSEMRELVQQLERCALPHTCPHGRPTIIRVTQQELERQFQRR